LRERRECSRRGEKYNDKFRGERCGSVMNKEGRHKPDKINQGEGQERKQQAISLRGPSTVVSRGETEKLGENPLRKKTRLTCTKRIRGSQGEGTPLGGRVAKFQVGVLNIKKIL